MGKKLMQEEFYGGGDMAEEIAAAIADKVGAKIPPEKSVDLDDFLARKDLDNGETAIKTRFHDIQNQIDAEEATLRALYISQETIQSQILAQKQKVEDIKAELLHMANLAITIQGGK